MLFPCFNLDKLEVLQPCFFQQYRQAMLSRIFINQNRDSGIVPLAQPIAGAFAQIAEVNGVGGEIECIHLL